MPKTAINFPQAMCTTGAQSASQKWVTRVLLQTLFVAVDKVVHLYTKLTLFIHHPIHSLMANFSSVMRPVVPTVHRAYKVLITSKFKLINRYTSGELL